ncbi:MAG: TetR/AcrR family transcriptional regulator [Bacteroidota bacterium]
MTESKLLWIQEGYFAFGRKGPEGLNVEQLAKNLQKSKSSFYYYFGDLELFQTDLLAYHIERADEIACRGEKCTSMDPDVINLIVDTKDDLLFNKQLRLHFQNPLFKECFERSFDRISGSFIDKWNLMIGLEPQSELGKLIFHLLVDNFFLQVSDENLSYQWFHEYLKSLSSTIDKIKSASKG